jgi:hypothetical protein
LNQPKKSTKAQGCVLSDKAETIDIHRYSTQSIEIIIKHSRNNTEYSEQRCNL